MLDQLLPERPGDPDNGSRQGVPLVDGEVAHAELWAHGWRFFGLDAVVYERRTMLALGPWLMAMTAFVSVMGNRSRRRAVERFAAPQWRPLGLLRVIVTSQRLLVWHKNQWWPVWFDHVTGVHADSANASLDLFFAADPPYRPAGPDIALLCAVLADAAGRVATG